MNRRRYAVVGTGSRIPMFIDPILKEFRDSSELVGLCDLSQARMDFHQQRVMREYGCGPIATYTDFDKMMREQKPETVIVCTPDYLHHEFIVRALEAGSDVISEKPLTTDADKCRLIFDAIGRTGRKVRTTFNARWSPGMTTVKRVIASGKIGQIKHVDFEYMLNTSHGADYFRRWHSQKEFSGGLLVHKSTHHFDLINWWIDGIPELVFAMGDLAFYGKKNAEARGQAAYTKYARYTGADESKSDPFRLDLTEDATLKGLYLEGEKESGYIRDQNVFREGITIEDTMSVLVRYRTGAIASYSLNCFCPIEGFNVSITGDGGRIEYMERHNSHVIAKEGAPPLNEKKDEHMKKLRVIPLFSEGYEVPIEQLSGDHGGADPLIQEQMFSGNPPAEKMGRNAGHEQGAASLLIGVAANQSMATGEAVKISNLLSINAKAKHLSELI